MTKKQDMSQVIRTFIDEYIEKNMDIIREDNQYHQILVQKENGKLEWERVRIDETDKNYVHIDKNGKAIYKKKR
jgi:hypothetical protein